MWRIPSDSAASVPHKNIHTIHGVGLGVAAIVPQPYRFSACVAKPKARTTKVRLDAVLELDSEFG